jgi:hypothetical protein
MKKISILLCLAFILSPLAARKVTFHMEQFGICPGAENLSSKLEQALLNIRKQVDEGDKVVLKFDKGRYDFHAADAPKREYYVSNHDQDQPKLIGICLENWNNLTLDGRGADFIFHGRMLPLALVNSKNCTLKNFSIDFAKPHIAQVEVVNNDAEKGITFTVAPWVDYRILPDKSFEGYGEGWSARYSWGIAFDGATRHIVYNTSDIGFNLSELSEVGPRTYLAPHWKDQRLPSGTVVALRTYGRPTPGIFLDHDVDTKLKNVKVHYAEGMGLIAQRCTNIDLCKFSVCLRGKDDPRYFTTQADATHFSQCKGKINSCCGLYEGMMDDAINVHGVYLKVRERINDHTLRCAYEHGQAWGFAWGDPGDSICFIKANTMDHVDGVNYIRTISPADKPTVKGAKEFIISFTKPVPEEVNNHITYGIENLSWTPEIVFRKNLVRNNRARGALFSSPRKTVCEKNVFDHTSGTAILLCGDCNGWYESGAVRDLVIRKNKFINALTSMFQFTNAVISIYPEIPSLKGQTHYFHGGKKGSIRIEDNEFYHFDAPLLYAKSVNGLVWKNNKTVETSDFKPFHWNKQPIFLERVRNAEIDYPGYLESIKIKKYDLK